jgi:putative transposase
MIDRTHGVSISRQAELVGISRSSVYYHPVPISDRDLALMRRLDRLHLEYPFAGSRMLRDLLNDEGHQVGRGHVRTLMQRMGIEALYRRPNTSKKQPGHEILPYRLRGLSITRANQVWGMDITYIPMARGFVYLCAVVDWASRKVLSHRVSITMDVAFCLEALEEACQRFGTPAIVNTDQGSQFTSRVFVEAVQGRRIELSMDGKGAWRDNVFVERIWRSVKYEEVYLHAYRTVSEAQAGIARYLSFYNSKRPHSKLDRRTPDAFYYGSLTEPKVAA